MTKYCRKCGNELVDGAKFCSHCGNEEDTDVSGNNKTTIEFNEQQNLETLYQEAIGKMNLAKKEEDFRKVAELFANILEYRDAKIYMQQCQEKAEKIYKDEIYLSAISKMDSMTSVGYETAIELFEKIPGWKEADKKIHICKEILERREIKNRETQKIAEQKQIEYENNKQKKSLRLKVVVCTVLTVVVLMGIFIKPIYYYSAISKMNSGENESAIKMFYKLKDYKDSIHYMETLTMDLQKKGIEDNQEIEVGDYIEFGMYELDGDTTNGKEILKWDVVKIEDGKMLLFCKTVVTYKEFDNNLGMSWEDSSLREWLNESFYEEAFNEELQETVLTISNENIDGWYKKQKTGCTTYWDYSNKDNYTMDKVFLLSMNDYFEYKEEYDFPACIYIYENGVEIRHVGAQDISLWMRSLDKDGKVCIMNAFRGITSIDGNEECAVCPAIWVSVE